LGIPEVIERVARARTPRNCDLRKMEDVLCGRWPKAPSNGKGRSRAAVQSTAAAAS